MKKISFTYVLLSLLLFACSTDNMLSTTYSFPKDEWHRFTNPLIQFQINNPGIFYDMYLELDYNISSTPEDFRMTVIMNTPSGEMRSRDIMTDFKSASVDGDKGVLRILLRREYAFREIGQCTFEVENRSSKMILPGMKNLRIIIQKSQ